MQTYFKADTVSHPDEAGDNHTVRFWTATEDGYSLAAAFTNIRDPSAALSLRVLWHDHGSAVLKLLSADRLKTDREREEDAYHAEADAAHTRGLYDALNVLVLAPATAAWLAKNDPKALNQARAALGLPDFEAERVSQTKADLRAKAEALNVLRGPIQVGETYTFRYNGVEEAHQALARYDGKVVRVMRKSIDMLWGVHADDGASFLAFDYELLPITE